MDPLSPRGLKALLCGLAVVPLLALLAPSGAQATRVPEAPALIAFDGHEAGAAHVSLSDEAIAALEAIASDSAASEIQLGYSDPASVLAAGALSLALPFAPVVVFTHVEVEYGEDNLVSLHALDEGADTEIALVIQYFDVLGSVRLGDTVYQILPLGDGLTAVYRYDTSQLRHHSEYRDAPATDGAP